MKKIFYVAICLFMASCSSPKEKDVKTSNVEVTDNTSESISEPTTPTVNTEDEKTVSNSDTSNDWDAALDDYDKYMDDYIKFIKKGKAGDQTAMLDAAELMVKVESVSKRLSEAKDEMTIKQIKKLTKIQNKIINAM